MPQKLSWIIPIFILISCHVANLNAVDMTWLGSFLNPKALSCYKCNSLTSAACKNISTHEHKLKYIEECQPHAKGCVKQMVKRSKTEIIFRECYYASVSTFLFTNFACEKIDRTASYEKALCYKCSGNVCNSGNRSFSALSMWLSVILLFIVSFILRM